MDKNLATLLKWGIENSTPHQPRGGGEADVAADPTTVTTETTDTTEASRTADVGARTGTRTLDPALIEALLGGPSDADLMRAAIETITDPDPQITHETRLTAFDNFELLVESIDNANNLAALNLWAPLLSCLAHPDADIRRMAAWSVGTAVQNNERCQDCLLTNDGLPPLIKLATDPEQPPDVRKKALYALSSACRNYQPALDVCIAEMATRGIPSSPADAADMEAVDAIIQRLRECGNSKLVDS